eukprot:GHVR01000930.1.p1 GENE.GHVR01000930.1~~GHVR01000930.1.p1  ORF type:complete len:100 (-),score=22.04 GHVR01000930.1:173-472(-)
MFEHNTHTHCVCLTTNKCVCLCFCVCVYYIYACLKLHSFKYFEHKNYYIHINTFLPMDIRQKSLIYIQIGNVTHTHTYTFLSMEIIPISYISHIYSYIN